MRINLIGPMLGGSGFVSHVRQLANALHNEGVDVRVDSPRFPGWELQCNDVEMQMLSKPYNKDCVSILVGQPQFLPFVWSENSKKTVCFVIWEGDKIPAFWIPFLKDEKTSQIWVPSEHLKKAILNTDKSLENKIRVIPHGVDTNLFKPREKLGERPFTFLASKGWSQGINDRGGLQFFFQAFCQEFGVFENVELRVKINPSYCGPGWDLNNELSKLGLPVDRPKMLISTVLTPYDMVPNFYEGDCFVNSTMEDAFGLTALESLSCGIPTISTDFCKELGFLNDDNSWFIKSEPVKVSWDISYEGISWRKSDIAALRKLMRYAFEHREECLQKGIKARQTAEQFTWKNSALIAKKLLEGL